MQPPEPEPAQEPPFAEDRCAWCGDVAAVAVRYADHQVTFCRDHKWVAAAASRSPGTEYVHLEQPRAKSREPRA